MTRIRLRRPSAPLLISVLALVMAMGGSSIAQDVVAEISAKIKGKQIAKNAITSKKIKNRTIKAVDVKPGVIPDAYSKGESDGKYQAKGDYLAANGKAADADTLDGKDSTEFLGKTEKAADAERLDNFDSSQFVRGGGAFSTATRSIGEGTNTTLLAIPGMPNLNATCTDIAGIFSSATVTLENPSSGSFNEAYMNDEVDDDDNGAPDLTVRTPFDSGSADLVTSSVAPRETSFNLTRRSALLGGTTTITNYRVFMTGVSGSNNCRFTAQALTQSFGGFSVIGPIGPLLP